MKRSRSIRLVLIGGLSSGLAAGCGRSNEGTRSVSVENVYTNDHHLPGVGYYHAPFRAWFPLPYNQYDPQTGLYFRGGTWATGPHASITNLSSPTAAAVQMAQAQRAVVPRGGFGRSSHHHSFLG